MIAKEYLESDISFNVLGPKHGMNGANLHKILCYRCGDKWEVSFRAKDLNIEETYTLEIPRLLPEETIQAIRRKSEARNSWDKKGQKHQYLFARLIFDADSGKALTGTCNSMGLRYYKPYWGCTNRYQVNATVLEKAVLEELFLALGSKASLHRAVFDGHPLGKVTDKIGEGLETKRGELAQVEQRLESYATAIGTADDIIGFMARIKPKIIELEARSKGLKDEVAALEYRLATLPDEGEIEAKRGRWAGLLKRGLMSYIRTGVALHQLPFEAQKKIIRLIFGGSDEAGRRYGIYVRDLGGNPRRYRFEAYGKLGAISGWMEAKTGESFSLPNTDLYARKDDKDLGEDISRVLMEVNPWILWDDSKKKVNLLSKRHAHHRLRFYQR